MVIRQGFKKVQIQGVEFAQMGQGGRLGHYPVHFHMARKTPPDTFVKDSSINESMTRWIVLHSTLGVTVPRNVGYKSIGHGFYLEDGTETDNKFYSNIGIFARAAASIIARTPRKVPGILADNQDPRSSQIRNRRTRIPLPLRHRISDGVLDHQWMERFHGQHGGRGRSLRRRLLVRARREQRHGGGAGHSRARGYDVGRVRRPAEARAHAGSKSTDFQGTTPLKTFYMNYATSTMHSFQTTGDAPDCNGFVRSPPPPTPALPS